MTMLRTIAAALLSWTALMGTAAAAEPGASDWASSESAKVRLVAAVTAAGQSDGLRAGLHFKMEPGWKIYWRSPGDAGYPPRLDWSGSTNAGTPRLHWPAPHRFVLAGLQNHGYAGEVVLPLDIPLPSPGRAVGLRVSVDFLACAQICVPQQADLALSLPEGAAAPSAFAHDIGRFMALVPGDGRRHGLSLEAVETAGAGDSSILRLVLAAAEPLTGPDAFVEAEDVAAFGQPRVSLSSDRRRAVIEAPVVPGTVLKPLLGTALRVTLTDGPRSMEAEAVPVAGAPPAPSAPAGDGLAAMLAIALLGGLILNLMPCVLPVLSIKLLGVLGHGGGERGHVRASFLASSAGIVVSFLALALAAIAVKQAGMAVGWGIQFQQPGFLIAMIALLCLFAANLWGMFEIPMPVWLLNRGGNGVPHHTLLGHFLSGAFATLLATPCSAPFLGTAIGFALARGSSDILAIFAALGLGMAAPFLVVAAWPDAALRMPRPGRWMVTARKAMGVALAATALWLGTVLAATLAPAPSDDAGGAVPWVAFDQAALRDRIKEGKVVFVDVTADWCITCKVNKAAVIERGEVAARLASAGIVAMRADWTRPDEAISRYLASFGRYGIPFNAVYGPSAPDGLALSELLTEAEVMAALDKAR
ncbi:protein-disulfide reductase DsbD [Magnetospirillum sp. SS-4]|uniref:protein-disulfide reductase DsbD family protein n=1 Tax=Magnetospirillum sp. SS-4 TaxID=2681465 RepID=UPI00137E6B51|nr:protein-disulfide reductase DsbD domain-containing protein [Magnetospirillum sp. SS-4]CAA7616583.1 Thiol:disulfide interchange protein dsbD 1 [Magnetospirillum sp. SS-4]